MKYIRLTQGKFAKVDDEDFNWLKQWKWCAEHKGKAFYAVRNAKNEKKIIHIYMHREILKKYYPLLLIGKIVDHKDGDSLNQLKTNLRIATQRENVRNQKIQVRHTGFKSSKFKGVRWHKRNKKWIASIQIMGRSKHLGYYDNEVEAAQAYNEAAQKAFGDFARLNTF